MSDLGLLPLTFSAVFDLFPQPMLMALKNILVLKVSAFLLLLVLTYTPLFFAFLTGTCSGSSVNALATTQLVSLVWGSNHGQMHIVAILPDWTWLQQ